jgi:tetratricopeptide (TPR) repeat protein
MTMRRGSFQTSTPRIAIGLATLLFMVMIRAGAAAPPESVPEQPGSSEIHRRFTSALRAYQAHEYKSAQAELEPLVKSAPESFEIHELLGLVLVAQGEQRQANPFLARAVRLRPNLAEARTRLAENLVALGRWNEAEAQLKKVVALEARSYDANHNLGEFYIQSGKLAEAISFLERAQEIDPAAYNNGYDLALAFEESGRLDGARQELERLIAVHNTGELHSLLGEVEEKSRNYVRSAAEYEQAARMEPSEQNILSWGAELLLHQTFSPAIEVFKAGTTRYPGSARLENGLGIAFYGAGRMDEAAQTFLRASELNASDALPLILMGKACGGVSPDLAAQVRARLKTFIGRDARNADVRYYYALCLWRGDQSELGPELKAQIESLLKEALSLNPGHGDAYFQLGNLYADERHYPEAVEQYQHALGINPNAANTHYRLGQALARAGNAARAQEEFSLFERLRKRESDATNQEQNQIQQFVYTMRSSDGGQR